MAEINNNNIARLLPVPPAVLLSDGFDEEMLITLPDREATFMVRVAGRELAVNGGVVMALHGGGYTAMSWAPVAALVKRDCCVLAPDLRGHGLTTSADDRDLSLDTLTHDVMSLLAEVFTSGALSGTRDTRQQQHAQQEQQQQQQHGPGAGEETACPSPAAEHNRTGGRPVVHNIDGDKSTTACASRAIAPQTTLENTPRSKVPEEDVAVSVGPDAVTSSSVIPAPETISCSVERAAIDSSARPAALAAAATAADIDDIGVDGVCVPAKAPCPEDAGGGNGRDGSEDGDACCDAGGHGGSGGDSNDHPPVKVLLIGHSLGGSIAVRVAAEAEELKRRCRRKAEVSGVVAVDVVEGTALAALENMPEVLRKIPTGFGNFQEAVMWHIKTGAMRNATSASIAVPSRLKDDGSGKRVVWRTDLAMTERHWRGWFEGLSSAFLALTVPKLLIVAGMDRLDTELTAAHMQGRFQLKLVYGCGHSIQEDQPGETAKTMMSFAFRNSILRRGGADAASGDRNPSDEEVLRRKLARARGQR